MGDPARTAGDLLRNDRCRGSDPNSGNGARCDFAQRVQLLVGGYEPVALRRDRASDAADDLAKAIDIEMRRHPGERLELVFDACRRCVLATRPESFATRTPQAETKRRRDQRHRVADPAGRMFVDRIESKVDDVTGVDHGVR